MMIALRLTDESHETGTFDVAIEKVNPHGGHGAVTIICQPMAPVTLKMGVKSHALRIYWAR